MNSTASRSPDSAIRSRENLLRALGTTGAGDKRARRTLLEAARSDEQELLRINALVALARGADVDELLRATLAGTGDGERAAAVCAMALTRDPAWIDVLEKADIDGAAADLALAREAALRVLREGDLAPLARPLGSVARDEIPRRRFFGGAGGG